MKFSHSLQFNSVPEWSSKYIAYSNLKKTIYNLQKEKLYNNISSASSVSNVVDTEQQPLLLDTSTDPYIKRFLEQLNSEVKKIDKFFISQKTGLIANYNELNDDIRDFEVSLLTAPVFKRRRSTRRLSSVSSNESMLSQNLPLSIDSGPDDEIEGINEDFNYYTRMNPLLQQSVILKKRIVVLFTQLSELKDYIELNKTGFRKICKKFDKSLNTSIKDPFMEKLCQGSNTFKPETLAKITEYIDECIVTYAKLSNQDSTGNLGLNKTNTSDDNGSSQGTEPQDFVPYDFENAKKELSTHLREHVVWERNTVWKDMMNLERKSQNAKASTSEKIEPLDSSLNLTLSDFLSLPPAKIINLVVNSNSFIKFAAITAIFILLLCYYSPFNDVLQQNCFAILIYASLLWATETIPLFVTSLFIPLLIVIFPTLKDPVSNIPLNSIQSSQYILSSMWTSVIMLLLGGFTLAAALSKYNIAKVLSTHILSSAGTNPKVILLTIMFVASFVSMWVSNVAAPVLCYSIIQPLLRTLPRHNTFSKSLILGIALASNVGGMASPIASPQNIFAFGIMNSPPSWVEWFIITTPVCIICNFIIWVMLLVSFPIDYKNTKILKLHRITDPFTVTQWFVSIVCVVTILLWCLSNKLSSQLGEMGIISIIPILLLFGTGLLSSDDFNNFMWNIVVLAMGGSTLGKAVSNSGLLATIAHLIKEEIQDESLIYIIITFGLCVLVMATFISHTVSAMIVVPLMGEIGANLPGDHSKLLIMISTLLCSCAMGLPTSGFPNVTAISMIDEAGDRYLSVMHVISRGVPVSIACYFIVVTVGFGMMKLLGY
ncbi:hypothetical protein KAFR_0F00850 [Kazachstania africana CBS 2517]|uniref:SPX domain-containing protein n=1 Tax=Kazachstania africana (strain ATCC 22294 / BCRC 22015 / CBS 2517 / CECT 1963 / NBRC 1671 / NRRL Y-8276) TaxID=1071382 RepID=H2AWD2_KAZAF|nr:hypothetical protein KAFR_0F00850 [Kazachstania africana CBS 2517]CCF58682.1 hypothetical protein KAFR_0F00850 [Kazachstania africana CBS 2517]